MASEAGQLVALSELGRLGRPSGKAGGLAWLMRQRAPVPETHVWRGPAPAPEALAGLGATARWAVRSSALAEDGAARSFAGQFDTVLDVTGAPALAEAVAHVLASAGNARAAGYRDGAAAGGMDVVIQRMIAPRLAGVAFSRNPVTGLNEIVIEAVEGLGEALVSEGRTPRRWVWRGGGFTARPAEASGEDEAVIAEVARGTERLARAYRRPADIEWAWDGQLWWLQIRPITTGAEVPVYSSRISKEVMPGLIKPLVWSINVPMVNGAWIRLLERGVGPTGLAPADLARQFAYRSYFNMSALGRVFELMGFPHDALEVMLGLPNTPRPRMQLSARTLVLAPRLVGFAIWLLGTERRFAPQLAALNARFVAERGRPVAGLGAEELLARVEALLPDIARAAELNIVVPLLANAHAALLRRRLRRGGLDPAEVDVTGGLVDVEAHDPGAQLQRLGASLLAGGVTAETPYAALPQERAAEVDAFIARFGHFSDSGNDLASAPWRETPDLVVRMAVRAGPARRAANRLSWDVARARLKGGRGLDRARARAAHFQAHREAISDCYTLGYGLLRPLMLELGRRLADSGRLAAADDVIFLSFEEVKAAIAGADLRATVPPRRADYAAAAELVLPETIYGDDFTPLPRLAAGAGQRLQGAGSSRGQYRGRLRVIGGTAEFDRVAQGDILVIPYSDVGWTPVFARAGAVVAESGGMLSHSSIVAREYGIPCVVSVPGAMQLPDGAEAVVDGTSGEVVVIAAPPGQVATPWRAPRPS